MGLCVIYPIEVVHEPGHRVGHSAFNGATRQVPPTTAVRSRPAYSPLPLRAPILQQFDPFMRTMAPT